MTTDYVDVRLESEELACDDIQVHKLTGTEAISRPFWFDLRIVSLDPAGLDAEEVVGKAVSIVFFRHEAEIRRIHAMVSEISECLDAQVEFKTYDLRLVPRLHRLSLIETQEIFLDLTVPKIIEEKLLQVHLTHEDFELRLTGTYPEREFVVQYKESDLAFISRLAEHLGVSFIFDHESGVDRIVFVDQQESFPKGEPALLRPRGDQRDVFRLDLKTRVIPAMYVCQDYNYRTPAVELSSRFELPKGFAGAVVEHGGHFKTPAEGDALAKVRAEERQVDYRVYTGQSDLPHFAAGHRIPLEGPHAAELLLVEVHHEASRAVLTHGGEGTERHYKNTFRAIPAEHTFRPARTTPRPQIHGLVTGVIEHGIELGPERFAVLDSWGRYTVRFLFDTAEHGSKQSRQIRMLQPHAGTNYGMRFPLKPGTEVLIGFVDGDPDRPLIVGATYRPDTPSPVTSANNTINKLKTESGVIIEIHDH